MGQVVGMKPAASGQYNHKYAPFSAITLDLGDLVPNRVTEVNPDDKWHTIEAKGSLRLAPQVFPAYGRCMLKTAAFFVPESQIVETSKAFHSDMKLDRGKQVHSVWFFADEFNRYFWSHRVAGDGQLCSLVGSTNTPATFVPSGKWNFVYAYDQGSGVVKYDYMLLTPLGRSYYKVAKSLGYDFVSYPAAFTGTAYDWPTVKPHVQFKVDAYPLLAYLKIYVDYFMNPYFVNSSDLALFLRHVHDVENALNHAGTAPIYQAGTGQLLFDWWDEINPLGVVVPFERNMYLDAWNSPNSPDGVNPENTMLSVNPDSLLSPHIPNFVSVLGGYTSDPEVRSDEKDSVLFTLGIPSSGGTQSQSLLGLSHYGLNNLESIWNYVQRNNLSGSKSVERFFSRFGIKPSDLHSHFASKLYEGSSDVDFSAVLSNTDNASGDSGKTLGAYAGFGVGGLNFKFDYQAADFGYIIVLNWIQIVPIKVRGMSPAVLRILPQDWYTPEYDGKHIRAIPQCEVGVNDQSDSLLTQSNADDQVFGYTDLYEDYRNQPDVVAGDFVVDEIAQNFLFARDFSYYRKQSSRIHLQPQRAILQYYKRVSNPDLTNPFQAAASSGDRFYLFVQYKMDASRNVTSKSAALQLNGPGEMTVELGGTQIS